MKIFWWAVLLTVIFIFPFMAWQVIGHSMGVIQYKPSTLIAYAGIFLSFNLPLLMGYLTYLQIRKHIFTRFQMLGLGLAGAILFVSSIYINLHDIRDVKAVLDSYPAWETSTLAKCQSLIASSPVNSDGLPIRNTILTVTGKTFDYEDIKKLQLLSDLERSAAARYIAVIQETYQETNTVYSLKGSGMAGGTPAVIYTWDVSVCDLEAGVIAAHAVLVGPTPPAEVSVSSSIPNVIGIRPRDQYSAWIDSLYGTPMPATPSK